MLKENKYMYPEAKMIDAMKIWKLPAGKEFMLSEMCQNGDYFLEEKIDGAWYQYEKTDNYAYLFGRGESKVTGVLTEKSANVPHIMEALSCLPKNTILIGEIYVPGGTSKNVTSIMGCLPELAIKRQENNPIHYYVHDIILYDNINLMGEGAKGRYDILEAIWKKHDLNKYDFLRLAAKVDENLEEEISRILKSGGEGAVLKKKDYPYVPGKRPAWSTIKVKQMDSIDLVCIGLCDATKEYTGKDMEIWPYWETDQFNFSLKGEEVPPKKIVYMVDSDKTVNNDRTTVMVDTCHYGQEGWRPITKPYFLGWKTAIEIGAYDNEGNLKLLGTVSSGLTDEDKQNMSMNPKDYIGKVVSLDCMSIDRKEKTLRHPVFKAWRDDKPATDCIISEIFKE